MSNGEDILTKVTVEAGKEVAKEVYKDAKNIVTPTTEIAGLLPRAIKAALLNVEKWIVGREYNLKETEKLLEEKLKNVSPESIVEPEAYIAVPALQQISYCMDNEELRNMYANLLANSMDKISKNDVHPSFVEIIKQLTPDEAKLLKIINGTKPMITLKYVDKEGAGYNIISKFSDIGFIAECEKPLDIEKYLNNLARLGVIEVPFGTWCSEKKLYDPLKNHSHIKNYMQIPQSYINRGYNNTEIEEECFLLTAYGKAFRAICVLNKK